MTTTDREIDLEQVEPGVWAPKHNGNSGDPLLAEGWTAGEPAASPGWAGRLALMIGVPAIAMLLIQFVIALLVVPIVDRITCEPMRSLARATTGEQVHCLPR